MKSSKIIPLILLATHLTGCVGISTTLKTQTDLCKDNCKFENNFGGHTISPRDKSSYLVEDRDKPTQSNLLKHWSKPHEIRKNGDIETWSYYESRWVGVTPMLIIPIPLMLPLRNDKVEIKFKNGKFLEAKEIQSVEYTHLCSIFPVIADNGGFCWSRITPRFLSFNKK